MLKLRTKTEFQVPSSRGLKSVIIRMVIDGIFMDKNNITPQGYYYYLDENNVVVKLDSLGNNSRKEWALIEQIEENMLLPFSDSVHLRANVLQRLKEFTNLQLMQESGENYNTVASDWENYI